MEVCEQYHSTFLSHGGGSHGTGTGHNHHGSAAGSGNIAEYRLSDDNDEWLMMDKYFNWSYEADNCNKVYMKRKR